MFSFFSPFEKKTTRGGGRSRRGSLLLPIPVYKNTAADDRRASRRYVRVRSRRVFTGLKHQCVELARRWCVRAHNTTFEEVDNASDIMSLRRGKCIVCGKPTRLDAGPISTSGGSDGSRGVDVRRGDLLVWKRGRPGPYRKTGHVAVVVKTGAASTASDTTTMMITVAEQNGTTRNGHRALALNGRTRRALAGRVRVYPHPHPHPHPHHK